MKENITKFGELISGASDILVVQASNPDGDSLGTSLALEQIFHELGKETIMYCPTTMPFHLRHLEGWGRVVNDLPRQFDLVIIVDTSSKSLLDKVLTPEQSPILKSKPIVVIDHHNTESTLEFETLDILDDKAVATGEIIYELAKTLGWKLNLKAMENIASSIMYDSMGLISEKTSAKSIEIIADVVRGGVSLTKLDANRREFMRKSLEITKYKGDLLNRIKVSESGLVASIVIPWEEIEKYSDQYNPSMLVIDDMRLADHVQIAVAYKLYPGGKITAKIRCNHGFGVADKIAEYFGGGGHQNAAGFKVFDKQIADIEKEFIELADKLVSEKS